jgi:hypothetical protein
MLSGIKLTCTSIVFLESEPPWENAGPWGVLSVHFAEEGAEAEMVLEHHLITQAAPCLWADLL